MWTLPLEFATSSYITATSPDINRLPGRTVPRQSVFGLPRQWVPPARVYFTTHISKPPWHSRTCDTLFRARWAPLITPTRLGPCYLLWRDWLMSLPNQARFGSNRCCALGPVNSFYPTVVSLTIWNSRPGSVCYWFYGRHNNWYICGVCLWLFQGWFWSSCRFIRVTFSLRVFF